MGTRREQKNDGDIATDEKWEGRSRGRCRFLVCMAAEHPNGEQARGTGVGEACEFHCGPFTKEPPGDLVATAAALGSILGLETEIPHEAAAKSHGRWGGERKHN